jgi:hypothetical protein
MATFLEIQIQITKLFVEQLNGRDKNCDEEITKIATAKCIRC